MEHNYENEPPEKRARADEQLASLGGLINITNSIVFGVIGGSNNAASTSSTIHIDSIGTFLSLLENSKCKAIRDRFIEKLNPLGASIADEKGSKIIKVTASSSRIANENKIKVMSIMDQVRAIDVDLDLKLNETVFKFITQPELFDKFKSMAAEKGVELRTEPPNILKVKGSIGNVERAVNVMRQYYSKLEKPAILQFALDKRFTVEMNSRLMNAKELFINWTLTDVLRVKCSRDDVQLVKAKIELMIKELQVEERDKQLREEIRGEIMAEFNRQRAEEEQKRVKEEQKRVKEEQKRVKEEQKRVKEEPKEVDY